MDFNECLRHLETIGTEEYQRLAQVLLGALSEHDIPLRELEHAVYSFDLILDQDRALKHNPT